MVSVIFAGDRFGEESLWMLGWERGIRGRGEGREEGTETLHVASVPERHIALAGSRSPVRPVITIRMERRGEADEWEEEVVK